MRIAERMRIIPPSGTMGMKEKADRLAREGRRILHLEVGEPDFETPEHIKQAAYQAIREGFTHYGSGRGILELRKAISEDLAKRRIEANPESEILITPGTKHAIYCACIATLNPSDEVLVLSPAWPTFYVCIQAAEARPVEVPTREGYSLNEEGLKERITRRTKMILVNSPNNPTGGALNEKEVQTVADLAKEYDSLVLSDEIYDRLVYDDFKPVSMASLDGMRGRTITVNGFSKTYAMTGWRLGYAAANKEIIEAMGRVQETTTTHPATFVQKAGVAALKGPQDCVDQMIKEYDRRRKTIVKGLNKMPGIGCPLPKGAFYAFPDFVALKKPSGEIVEKLLEEEGVCTTAGSIFGAHGEGHIRFSYATSLNVILEAMEKLRNFVEKLQA
jgi:aspartate/methionine/tyrosine aminotransferase